MLKNINTLKDFEQRLRSVSSSKDEIIQEIKDEGYYDEIIKDISNQYVVSIKYFDKVEKSMAYCPFCDQIVSKDGSYMSHKCYDEDAEAEVSRTIISSYGTQTSPYLYQSKSGVFFLFRLRVVAALEDIVAIDDIPNKLKNPKWNISFNFIDCVFSYTDKHKFRLLENYSFKRPQDVARSSRLHYHSNVKNLNYDKMSLKLKDVLTLDSIEPHTNIYDAVLGFKLTNKRKANSKKKPKEFEFNCNDDVVKDVASKIHLSLIIKDKVLLNQATYNRVCLSCKHTSKITVVENSIQNADEISDTCSNCGADIPINLNYYSIGKEKDVFKFIVSDVLDGEYIQRFFSYKAEYKKPYDIDIDDEYNMTDSIKTYLNEDFLVKIFNYKDGFKKEVFVKNRNGKYQKERLKRDSYLSYHFVDHYDYLKDIKESNIKYSGLEVVINNDMNSEPYNYNGSIIMNNQYIDFWIKYPKSEMFVKNPLYIDSFLSMISRESVLTDDESPFDVETGQMRIRKNALSALKNIKNKEPIKNRDGELEELNQSLVIDYMFLLALYMMDKAYEEKGDDLHKEEVIKVFHFISSQYGSLRARIADYIEIYDLANIKIGRAVDYIDNCYWNQCIENNDAKTIWRDYLRMAVDMNYNINDNSVLFPSSLKKEHDITAFAYRVAADEIKEKKFTENAALHEWLEYQGNDLSVVVPKQISDLVNEGNALKHCVASYVSRVNKDRVVVFIRQNDSLDESFYTMEITNKTIVQLRGFANKSATHYVKDFVKQFAKKKQLKISY